jgi:hypothetical protein
VSWVGKTLESRVEGPKDSRPHAPLGTLPKMTASPAAPRPEFSRARSSAETTPPGVRPSYGLKDLIWLVGDHPDGCMLDLGPAWQATVDFFLERRFRISVEDLLVEWKDFQAAQEREAAAGAKNQPADRPAPPSPHAAAEAFLQSELQYPDESMDAILAWDFFDYATDALAVRLAARLFQMLRPGGCVLAIFHARPPDVFHRYRIVAGGIELRPAPAPARCSRVFQNREILQLFGQFRSAKTYVGRDQIREGLFVK